jgi:LacI family transcriptional regulator
MSTIRVVAEKAGVSTATVSRVLNGNPTVDPDLAKRVQRAAAELGYLPSTLARSLRTRSTGVLSLIVSDITNPFFAAVTRGVEDTARANNLAVLLGNTDETAERESEYLTAAVQAQVAGVILAPHTRDTDIFGLVTAGIKVVVIDRPIREPVSSIMVNNRGGARAATTHLLEQGWHRPACITGPITAATAQERLRGYEEALRAAGLSKSDQIVARSTFNQAGGRVAAEELLDSVNPPDAFLVANAPMTLGVLAELKHRDLRAGNDIGLVTFDDAPWMPHLNPPVSAVAQPAYQIGALAVELLVEQIHGDGPVEPRWETLETEFVERASSRRTD